MDDNASMDLIAIARRMLASALLVLAFATGAAEANAAVQPDIGPLEVTRGGFDVIKAKYLRVEVAGAQRVVFWVNNRKHEAHPGKPGDCGTRSCRTWWVGFWGTFKEPLPFFEFKIVASNPAGKSKTIGFRCKQGPFCFPYTVKCLPFDASKWNRLSTEEIQPTGSPLWFYARTVQNCGSLLGYSRDELYAALGEPTESGKAWASWYLWEDFGDLRTLEVWLRQDRVVAVRGPF